MKSLTVASGKNEPPLEPHGGDSGGNGRWQLLTVAKDGFVAHLLEGRLLAEGVEVVLDTSNPAPGAFLKPFGDPLAPVKVLVRSHDFDQATLILHDVDHQPPDPFATGSRRIRMLWIATVAAILGVAMLMVLDLLLFRAA
ncbi:MAG: hypothetical protein ABIS18_10980 [Actinomycetota bacterium]